MFKMMAAALMALATTIATTPDTAVEAHGDITVSASRSDDGAMSCDDINVRFDDERGYRDQEELPVGDLRSLDLQAARNGGVRVDGWDQSRYAVTVCKAAASADLLRELHVSVDGNKVTASGPDSRNWVIHYLVHAPRNATLNLESRNGPLSVHHVSGTITAHAKNGPITLKDVDGTIDATSVNGPIAYSGASGTVKLVANNGPLAVKLSGTHWEGTIDGRTENGPLALKVPRGFDSGVVLTSEGHGPIACRAAACGGRHVVRDEDDEDRPRQLSFGSGAKAITLTTVNGPLAVKEIDE